MAWTTQQQAAIDARGASLVVSAAAGSGKTSVLVTRITELLADASQRYPAEKTVVVTFTNDAAAEVRTRLNAVLGARVQAEPDNAWLSRQFTLLQSMKVSTIHSFCFDFLREHCAALHISAGFRIMDSTEETILRNEAAKQSVTAFCEQAAQDETAKQALDLLYDAFCADSDSALEQMILALYHLEEDTPFGANLLRDAAARCEGDGMEKAAVRELSAVLEDARQLYADAMSLLSPVGTEKQIAGLSDEQLQTDLLISALAENNLPLLGKRLAAMQFGRLMLTSKKHPETLAAVKALRTHAKSLLTGIAGWAVPLQFAPEDLPRHAALLNAADALVTDFSARLRDMKLERDAIGFSDAISMTLSLVAKREADGSITKTPLAEDASAQYACIMIDEFQDADNQQDLIFRMLSQNGNANRYGNNLFVVGDSKQCIYRFRNANPQNFYRALCESAPFVSKDLTENTCIHLNRNFRSAAEVIAAVNLVFSRLMTEAVGEIAYDDTQALVQGAVYPELNRPVSLLMLESAGRIPPDEAGAVAETIAKHIAMQTPVRSKDGTLRPCEPADFLILLRNSTHMQAYAEALEALHIPCCSIEESSYLDSPEITLLLDILRAIDNPLLDVPVAAAMCSPLHSFSLDELTAVRLFRKKGALYHAVSDIQHACEREEQTGLPAETVRKCVIFYQFLEEMRLCSAMETPEKLIRRIYDRTDFLGMMQMLPNGAQRKANLRALITYAKSYESTSDQGLSGFLRMIDRLIRRKVKLSGGGVPAGSENVVSIKTIHKSKGLEAPFVILAETHTPFRTDENTSDLLYHAECGIGFRLRKHSDLTYDSTLPYLTAAARNERESLSEELRLLYVALTRAKEYLILPIRFGGKTLTDRLTNFVTEQAVLGYTDRLTRQANSMRDWLMMILLRNPACEDLRRILDIPCGSDSTQPPLPVTVTLYHAEEAPENEEETGLTEAADTALAELLRQQCAWEYREKGAALTAKYGVSELAKQEDFSAPLRRPAFVQQRRGLTGAERGTALHSFLQYADFAAAHADLQAEIARMQETGRLTPKQAETVSRSKIGGFFNSGLYRRIAAAKEIWRERKFTVRLSDLELKGELAALAAEYAGTDGMLVGIMDLVLVEEDGLVLIDYKTDSVRSTAVLLERYTTQIQLYAAALRLMTEQPVKESMIYSIKLNRTVKVTLA